MSALLAAWLVGWAAAAPGVDASSASVVAPMNEEQLRHQALHEKLESAIGEFAKPGCLEIPDYHRSYCPLTDKKLLLEVADLPDGVRVVMDSRSIGGLRDIQDHARCLRAFGQARGKSSWPCPLLLRRAEVEVGGTDAETTLTIRSAKSKESKRLKAWAASVR